MKKFNVNTKMNFMKTKFKGQPLAKSNVKRLG